MPVPRIISVEERAKLLEALDGSAYQVSAGGSLANTLVAASHLCRADHCNRGGGPPSVGMLSVSGDDLQVHYSRQCSHPMFHCSGFLVDKFILYKIATARPTSMSCAGVIPLRTDAACRHAAAVRAPPRHQHWHSHRPDDAGRQSHILVLPGQLPDAHAVSRCQGGHQPHARAHS